MLLHHYEFFRDPMQYTDGNHCVRSCEVSSACMTQVEMQAKKLIELLMLGVSAKIRKQTSKAVVARPQSF